MTTRRFKLIAAVFLLLLLVAPGAFAAHEIIRKDGSPAPSIIYTNTHTYLKTTGVAVKKTNYYSSDPDIATISGNNPARLRGIAPGTVKITAKHAQTGEELDTKTFTVKQRANKISVTPEELNLAVKQSHKLKTILTPSTSTDVVKFYTSNRKVATVGIINGKVTARGPGTATITAYAVATKNTKKSDKSNKIATVTVNVKEDPGLLTGLKNNNDVSLVAQFSKGTSREEMENIVVTIDGEPADVKKTTVNVKKNTVTLKLGSEIEDGQICKVSFKGMTLSVKSRYTRCQTLEVSPASLELPVGSERALEPAMTPKDSTDHIRYKSANEKIATVTKNGLVTARKPGETDILVYATKKETTKLANKGNVVTSVHVNVTEIDAISEAKQIGKKKVRMTFFRDTKGIAASTIQILGAEPAAKAKVAFKNAVDTVSGKQYILDVVLDDELIDGRRYTVVYTPQGGEKSQAEFTAMDLLVAGYEIMPGYVVEGIPTLVSAWAVNSEGQRLYGAEGGITLKMLGEQEGVTFVNNRLTIDQAGKEAEIYAGVVESSGQSAIITCVAKGGDDHLFCAALYPDHRLDDGKEHVPGDCGQQDHFKCDGDDHAQAQCQIAAHYNCDDLDHDPADCLIAGHYECRDKHDPCPICTLLLCLGGEHGPGKCKPPLELITYTIQSGTEPDFDNINHTIKKGASNLCFLRFNYEKSLLMITDYDVRSKNSRFTAKDKGYTAPNILYFTITGTANGDDNIIVDSGSDIIATLPVMVTN